jgi:hypothetical protein
LIQGLRVGLAAATVLVFLTSGCDAAAHATPAPQSTAMISATRIGHALAIDVPGWSTVGAQVFVCPRAIPLMGDPARIAAAAVAASCFDAGMGPAAGGIHDIRFPFDSLTPGDLARFGSSPRWTVVVIETPPRSDRSPRAIQEEVVGGPIE